MNKVAKVIEISASSDKSIEDAVKGGLKKASKSLKNMKSAWLNEIRAITDDDGSIVEWRVNMRVNFLLD